MDAFDWLVQQRKRFDDLDYFVTWLFGVRAHDAHCAIINWIHRVD